MATRTLARATPTRTAPSRTAPSRTSRRFAQRRSAFTRLLCAAPLLAAVFGGFHATANAVASPLVFGTSEAALAASLQIMTPGARSENPGLGAYVMDDFSSRAPIEALGADAGASHRVPYGLEDGHLPCAGFIFPSSNACALSQSAGVSRLFETAARPSTGDMDTDAVVREPQAFALLALGLAAVVLPGRRRVR